MNTSKYCIVGILYNVYKNLHMPWMALSDFIRLFVCSILKERKLKTFYLYWFVGDDYICIYRV